MRRILLSFIALAGLLTLGACTSLNNCSGNGFANAEYCTGTLHPNAGPYAARNMQ
jgi:hypothetical protein